MNTTQTLNCNDLSTPMQVHFLRVFLSRDTKIEMVSSDGAALPYTGELV